MEKGLMRWKELLYKSNLPWRWRIHLLTIKIRRTTTFGGNCLQFPFTRTKNIDSILWQTAQGFSTQSNQSRDEQKGKIMFYLILLLFMGWWAKLGVGVGKHKEIHPGWLLRIGYISFNFGVEWARGVVRILGNILTDNNLS